MIPTPTVLDVARLLISDVKIVVVFLESPATADDYPVLERAAAAAGFEGDVVAVWPDRYGRTHFFARPERHVFFQIVNYDQLRAQVSGMLELP